MSAQPPPPALDGPVDETEPAGAFDLVDRVATGVATALPALAVLVAGWQAWDRALHPTDLAIFAVLYLITGLGITVGYHRLLTHRSFKTKPWMRVALAIAGSAAVEGPVIEWVANHRKHHAYSDRAGDPHSPHVGRATGWRGALSGLAHAHLGWVFRSPFANQQRYAPDLLADRGMRFIDRTFLVWVLLGLALPFAAGAALTASWVGALTALLWGGGVRIFLLHHVTFSINSLCHFFGRRDFHTDDESRNLAWLAPLSLGEAWHNNHHAFPTSARHGLRRGQLDLSALVIAGLQRVGLAWHVVRISDRRRHAKLRSRPDIADPTSASSRTAPSADKPSGARRVSRRRARPTGGGRSRSPPRGRAPRSREMATHVVAR